MRSLHGMVDLLTTKNSTLMGTIGELVAWNYLRHEKRIWGFKIGGWPYSVYPFTPMDKWRYRLAHNHLSKKQVSYLRHMVLHGSKYDFYGEEFQIIEKGERKGGIRRLFHPAVYLIEVKTMRSRHDLRRYERDLGLDIVTPKKAGFRILLVTVQLLDDWKCAVRSKEL